MTVVLVKVMHWPILTPLATRTIDTGNDFSLLEMDLVQKYQWSDQSRRFFDQWKEQGSIHARTATMFSTSQPQMVHHQHATRRTRPNIRLKGYAANQSPRPTPPPVISPSLTITISRSKAHCGWNVSWCSKHCSPMVGRCGCWFLPKHHGDKCRPSCVQWWGGGGPVEILVVLDRGRHHHVVDLVI